MRTYGFGVIGCGRISKNHMESIQALSHAVLIAASDLQEGALQRSVEKYHCKAYLDYKKMLKDPAVDIVTICTESGFHAQLAIDAMRAGKHVLVEKPMAMSLAEADLMIQTARQMGVKLGISHQNRFNPPVQSLRKALEAGRFGRLTHAAAVLRWNRNDAYYEQAPWRGTWAMDGGCLMNQAIHVIDLLQWMMGPAESAFAYTATNLRNIEGEDTALAILKFRNGAFASIEAATTIYPRNLEETLSVFGTEGTVCIGGVAVNKMEIWRFEGEKEEEIPVKIDKEPPNVYGFGHADLIEDMIEAIEQERDPIISGEEGRKALELILGIYHSVRYKKEIHFPLREKFTIGITGY